MFDYTIPDGVRYDERIYDKGERILSDLENNRSLYILAEGNADVIYNDVNGESLRVFRYDAPDFFGEVELFTDNSVPLPVVAVDSCLVRVIEKDDVFAWLRADFDFCAYIMRRLCEKMYENMYRRASQRFLTQKQQYSLAMDKHRALGDLASVTKAGLCEELGMPLRSLNRVISQCPDAATYKNKRFI